MKMCPQDMYRSVALVCVLCMATLVSAFEPVTLVPPSGDYWTGARVPVVVELRAKGSFSGVATFQLPALPETQVVKVGHPVISSESSAEGELFVQRHEFALFSQRSGELTIPAVPVEFGVKAGTERTKISGEIPSFTIQLKRPPDIPAERFVVSSSDYEIHQSWSTEAEKFEVGDVLTRKLSQSAEELSGMALPPLPLAAPTGVRVYPPQVSISDKTQRGAFSGEREEELRYRFETAGTVRLPAVTFQWWNPQSKALEQKVVEGRTVKVKGPLLAGGAKQGFQAVVAGILVVGAFLVLAWKFRKLLWSRIPRKKTLPPLNFS
ncbi:hypothetical protein P3T73_17045 [Kiritimatiellota bacterium B12222]|nr:hypothetical protein P3T73_17045 [Kiritimatiellota bacterium B12222]